MKYLSIPIKILTPKIPGKQDSIFYAGKKIAEIKIRNRTYVLTTAGKYQFLYKVLKSPTNSHVLYPNGRGLKPSVLTDAKIKNMNRKGQVENWGWFSINIWETRPNIPGLSPSKDQCLFNPTKTWSKYDEAMNAFIKFVKSDLAI